MDYQKAYTKLFNEMSAIHQQVKMMEEMTSSVCQTIQTLIEKAQQSTEEMYIVDEEERENN